MTARRSLTKWFAALCVLHGIVVCAGFFAPYDPSEQDRRNPYLPPMRLHLQDTRGQLHLRPFVYSLKLREGSFDQYQEDQTALHPLHFFLGGADYRLLGFVPCRWHLFGVENSRVYLLGSDGYGRDQFFRLLYGGQVSLLAGLLGAALTLVIGAGVGSVAGYFGGWREDVLMRLSELFLALPWLYVIFALRAFLPLGTNPLQAFFLIIAVISAVLWGRPPRLVLGRGVSAKKADV